MTEKQVIEIILQQQMDLRDDMRGVWRKINRLTMVIAILSSVVLLDRGVSLLGLL